MTIDFVNILFITHLILLILISLRVLARYDLTAPARLVWLVVLFLLPYILNTVHITVFTAHLLLKKYL